MRTNRFASTLLVAPLLLALAPRADEITFHPSNDSKLAKSFTIKSEMELGDVSFDVNGQDMSGMVPSDLNFGFEVLTDIVDHYIKVEGGKPIELVRQFAKFNASYHAMEESDSTDGPDMPDGKNEMHFKWNEDRDRYDISDADGKPAPDELQFIGIDMDLSSLLPGKAVSQGDPWKVNGSQLAAALIPGIDLDHLPDLDQLVPDQDEETAMGLGLIKTEFLPQLEKFRQEWKADCRYTGQRDVDDKKLAVIQVKLDAVGTIDLAGFMRAAMKEGAHLDEGSYTLDDATLKLTVKGDGELLWDIQAGHAHGFDWTAKIDCVAKLAMSVNVEEQTVAVKGSAELGGNCHWTMELK